MGSYIKNIKHLFGLKPKPIFRFVLLGLYDTKAGHDTSLSCDMFEQVSLEDALHEWVYASFKGVEYDYIDPQDHNNCRHWSKPSTCMSKQKGVYEAYNAEFDGYRNIIGFSVADNRNDAEALIKAYYLSKYPAVSPYTFTFV